MTAAENLREKRDVMSGTDIERCVCGAEIRDFNAEWQDDLPVDERWPMWGHVPGSDTRCTKARRVADIFPDRDLITRTATQMAELGNRTRQARGEFERFQSLLAEVKDEAESLRRQLDQPDTIRRATLNQVWDKLVDRNEIAAAQIVRDMIRDDS